MVKINKNGFFSTPLFGALSEIAPKKDIPLLTKKEVALFAPFNGISGARLALEQAGLTVTKHFVSEIDKHANFITMKHYPDTIQLGDITKWREWNLEQIKGVDFFIAGFPCINLSIAKKDREGLKGEHSGLFWEAYELWKIIKPTYWIIENVASMPNEDMDVITECMGVAPRYINSALVSAQNRQRLYWTNIPVGDISDEGILLQDILESGEAVQEKSYTVMPNTGSITHKDYFEKGKGALVFEKILADRDKSFCLDASYHKGDNSGNGYFEKGVRQVVFQSVQIGTVDGKNSQGSRVYSVQGKSISLCANGGGMGAKTGLYKVDLPDGDYVIRKLTPLECERLQTFPDGWTEGISKTQRYKCLGNSFTVKLFVHMIRQTFNKK